MKKIFLALSLLSLAACSVQTPKQVTGNPLVEAQYYDELADRLASLIITNDPMLKDTSMRAYIDKTIADAKNSAGEAHDKQSAGIMGRMIPAKQQNDGTALYVHDTLYFSSDFFSDPGPDLHVYMTQAVDPRDIAFPDKTALDLGSLQTPYGAQQYAVPHQEQKDLYRTVVLYDKGTKRVYGFVQLSK